MNDFFKTQTNTITQTNINWENKPSTLLDKNHSYWAVHFCSVLELINYHFQLGLPHNNYYNQKSSILIPPVVTLKELNSENIVHTLRSASEQLRNWGAQYFLVNYLNYMGFSETNSIFQQIASLKGWSFNNDVTLSYVWYVSGRDSIVGNEFLEFNGNLFFCSTQHSSILKISDGLIPHTNKDSLYNTDLLLHIKAHSANTGFVEMMGLFGEVEGGTNSAMSSAYFRKKSQHISFGIDIISSEPSRKNPKFIKTDTGNVVVLELVTNRHSIMYDFSCALSQIEAMFTSHPKPFNTTGAMGDILAYIHTMWDKDLNYVINQLQNIIEHGDQIFNNNPPVINPASIIRKSPSII